MTKAKRTDTPSELDLIVSQTLLELRPPSTSCTPSPIKDPKDVASNDISTSCPSHCHASSSGSCSCSDSSSGSGSSGSSSSSGGLQFPDLDRSGRPKQMPVSSLTENTNTSASKLNKKRVEQTEDEIWSEIKQESSMLKVMQ